MKVVMTVDIGGTRDHVKWPPRGSIVELPDEEAETMLVSGYAATIKQAEKHEEKTKRPFVKRDKVFDMVRLAQPVVEERQRRREEQEREVALAAAANVERAVQQTTRARGR